jgi:glycine dehydrogenase
VTSPFLQRHLGPSEAEQHQMLQTLGYQHLDDFIKDVVPDDILDAARPATCFLQGVAKLRHWQISARSLRRILFNDR